MNVRHFVQLCLVLLVCAVVGCGSAPYTDRNQLLLLSNQDEAALGLESYREVVGSSQLSSNQAWVNMVRRSGQRIADAARGDMPYPFEWEFSLIADPSVNAFCLPGGKVAFYEGIMPVCQTEAGVAVVMGHEVAHAIARHGNERVSQNVMVGMGLEAAPMLMGSTDPVIQSSVAAALGIGAQVGVLLPFSRNHESEADRIGLILMAKAGYDPREAPRFWQRMESLSSGGRPPEFLSTHPNPDTRIQQLNAWMPEALEHYTR
jgi:predicted Zn-dependent protease